MKSKRDWIKAILRGEKDLPIPQQWMSFFNKETAYRLTPVQCHYEPMWIYEVGSSFSCADIAPSELDKLIAFNNYTGRCMTSVGRGANIAFGHGGPGEFACRTIEQGPNHLIMEYETGVKAKVQLKPHFYHTYDHPVKEYSDAEKLSLPDSGNAKRYSGYSENIEYLKSRGEYVICPLNGFFSGLHYFLCDYQQLLMAFVLDEKLIEAMLEKLGNWNLQAAKKLAACGADCIALCDDLGSKEQMLISPDMYRRFVKPWHERLCTQMRDSGVDVHLHSHGAIMPILDDIADCGFSFVNPFDPEEGFDIKTLLKEYGSEFVITGGFPASYWDWPFEMQQRHLEELTDLARKGGKFICMDSGGVAENVSRESFDKLLAYSRKVRGAEDWSYAV